MLIFLICWLLAATIVLAAGILHTLPFPPPLIAATLAIVVLVTLILSRRWRERALALGVKPMIAFHLTRFVGFYFLWMGAHGLISRHFAETAGWGDVIIAGTALVLLMLPDYRTTLGWLALVIWNILGLLDILMVLVILERMAIADPGFGPAFRSLQLGLLPLYIVPIVIVTHALMLYMAAVPAARSKI